MRWVWAALGFGVVQASPSFFCRTWLSRSGSEMMAAMAGVMLVVSQWEAATSAPTPQQRAHDFIASVLPGSQIPGLGVAVVQKGQAVYTAGFGVKQLHGPATAENTVTADTLFEIGSCTKTFIAMGLAHFVQTKTIDWNTPVITVLPWFQGFDAYFTKNVNIGDLLAHRTGLGDHDGDLLWLMGGVSTEEELVRRLQYLPLRTSMRETFMYSNLGYEIAAIVLAKLAGTTWDEYLSKNVWQPLGMKSTAASTNQIPQEKRSAFSWGHYVWYDLNASQKTLPFDYFAATTPQLSPGFPDFGAGSVVSSPNDYARWMIELLTSQNTSVTAMESGQMIVPNEWASLFMMLKQEVVGNSIAAGYGFDVVGHTFYNQRFFTKGGDTLFHKTRTGFLPDHGLGVSLMANVEGDYLVEIYLDGIRNALLQIFIGESDAQVQAGWQPLQIAIETYRRQLPSGLPNSTLVLPLTTGTLTVNYRAYVEPQEQVSIITKCDTIGLPPFKAAASYAGTYSSPYYGSAVVTVLPNNLLSLSYGTFNGTLCRLSTTVGATEQFLWPNGTLLSALFSSPYIPTEFGGYSGGFMQSLNLMGLDFNRNPVLAKFKHVKRPAFSPSPFI